MRRSGRTTELVNAALRLALGRKQAVVFVVHQHARIEDIEFLARGTDLFEGDLEKSLEIVSLATYKARAPRYEERPVVFDHYITELLLEQQIILAARGIIPVRPDAHVP